MKKKNEAEMADELRPEYDLRELLKDGVRGKYADTSKERTWSRSIQTWPKSLPTTKRRSKLTEYDRDFVVEAILSAWDDDTGQARAVIDCNR